MSKKDQERAAKSGEVHRDGKTVKMEPCPIEGCAHFIDDKSDLGLCTECDRIGRVVKYGVVQALLHYGILKKGPAPEKQGQGPVILIPKPGQERAAIIDAAAKAGMDHQRIEGGGRS